MSRFFALPGFSGSIGRVLGPIPGFSGWTCRAGPVLTTLLKRDKFNWLDVCKVKDRLMVDVPCMVETIVDGNLAFQEDEPFNLQLTEASIMIDESGPLNNVNGELVQPVDDEAEISDNPIRESKLEDESEDEYVEADDSD